LFLVVAHDKAGVQFLGDGKAGAAKKAPAFNRGYLPTLLRVRLVRSYVCLADADVNRTPSPDSGRDVHPRPGIAVIPGVQEHPFAVKETAEAEMASMFEEVAADHAAMSEIRTVVAINIASNPVVTVELAAINIALTVVKVAAPALLIVERSALRPLGEVRAS
jgi:hypothetical protein